MLFKIKDMINQSNSFSISESISPHKDRLELQATFHWNKANGGVSGSKFIKLPPDISEPDFYAAAKKLKEETIEYFLTTQESNLNIKE